MMGAAMLKHHQFVQSHWGWPKCVRRGVRRSPCELLKIKSLSSWKGGSALIGAAMLSENVEYGVPFSIVQAQAPISMFFPQSQLHTKKTKR